jgi:hypothetical protein
MQIESHENSKAHGFWAAEPNIGEKLMLMVTELAEACEEWRKGIPLTEIYWQSDKPEGFPIEMADVLIRMLDFCEGMKIDLQAAYNIKVAYNEGRPYMHGGKIA